MKLKQSALGVALVLLAGSAAATSLDYRTEYKHESEDWAHRIKISDSTKAFGGKLAFGVEQKFQSEQNDNELKSQDFWKGVERGDSEFSWDWTKSVGESGKWYIQPGMPVTFGSTKTTWKPQFRVGYKADFGLTTALRYRHELQMFNKNASSATLAGGAGKVERADSTVQQGKLTLTGSYKFAKDSSFKDLKLSYEANYNYNYDDIRLSNDNNWEWDLGIKAGYVIGDFQPYLELWTIKGQDGSSTDERQLRTRAGIKYSF
ncbi:oligogalacturonate-specific porin KdgM family protein [Vibrio methylphosphonaticus]|uniref:oligogalacturonate-specific porin KdgM family protein n=1 Tax=Vibrio methylphosphonaticus TaxID=2946866 RepID=UPI00202A08B8|nr:oligogalacturonate-specific porin KdgM family protein [Vibrio methylphosphonaticus]MCL9774426.1 oligogalacturonate-specific porin KdgM family protein [Vibrio methylphosphonaticus]